MSNEVFKPHLFSYSTDGAKWSLTVQAMDEADARRRLSMAAMGHYDGIVYATIPAYPGVGFLVRAITFAANLFRR